MTTEQIKNNIKFSLQSFANGNLTANALKLFQALGYVTERQASLYEPTFAEFKETYVADKKFDATKAKVSDWKYVDLLFQLSKEEVLKQISLFDTKKVDSTIIETYLFFTIELSREQYSRTELSLISREVNRLFPMPVMILFKHGSTLTLSVINRRLHKRDESKDVLEKVTLIKDINIANPHRAHIEILFDLSFDELKDKFQFTNFVELHNAWQKTLDTKELNKRFFNELANWYFWATTKVVFPDDEIEDKEIRNATGVIRLITRLMFVWFLKEKNLVSEDLFDEKKLKQLLKYTDENKSTYYKAILQNLFFATLNTEMGRRKFRSAADKSQNGHYFIHNLFRYEKEFFKPKETLEKYFDPIPFLNGGLFECLDKQVEKNGKLKAIRIDGFSDRDDNVLKMPDELFFSGKEKTIDLSKVYGTPKKSKEKVRGLIDILNSYKFTIAENTPIEEEVALDPELLGKVFENLLANYNPETQTTARKQTGSFYTPREIVNYMVDESLLAYLKQNLDDNLETESNLRELFSYSEKEFHFTNSEREKLINAIDNIKIIDPACGSGAFPMGILHKLVHVLHKLDPRNQLWKQRQIEKASSIDDITSRAAAIATIKEAFENNELDYGRKLYLIENCIYGVDIQPIAVQISKLRFFISLIVEQKTNPKKENLGVRPLPNLETKFVAANTLMKLEKENANLFTNPEIEKKKEQLKKVRHDYFEARTPKRKENCRNKDKQLRDELAELLVTNHDLQPATAKKIVAWDPYDQNTFASFFDAEWMFGLKDGFDVVIGNPPYVQIKQIPEEDKPYYIKNFKFATGRFNLFYFFIEITEKLTRKSGITSYIVPDRLLLNTQCYDLRSWLLIQQTIIELDSFDESVFESAVVDSIILFYKNIKNVKSKILAKSNVSVSEINYSERINIPNTYFTNSPNKQFDLNYSENKSNLIERIRETSKKLGEISDTRDGIIQSKIPDVLFLTSKENKFCKKLLFGKDINRFQLDYNGNWVNYQPDEMMKIELKRNGGGLRLRTKDIFEREKILTRQTADEIIGTLDNEDYYYSNTLHGTAITDNTYDIRFILALLNSKVLNYYYKATTSEGGKVFAQVKIEILRQLPIKYTKNQKPIITAVSYCLLLKNNRQDATFFERLIDAMVYELYLPGAIQNAKCEVLKHLNDLPELKEGEEEKNLKTIEKVYKELSDPKHPVSRAIEKMDGVEEIRIIEGKK